MPSCNVLFYSVMSTEHPATKLIDFYYYMGFSTKVSSIEYDCMGFNFCAILWCFVIQCNLKSGNKVELTIIMVNFLTSAKKVS